MQYTKRDWRNRNRIKTPQGLQWLTIPIASKGRFFQRIKDARVVNKDWSASHWKFIKHCYSRAKFWKEYREFFERLYEEASRLLFLSDINQLYLREICKVLKIPTLMTSSSDYQSVHGEKTDKLVQLCLRSHGTHYLSGPKAKSYLQTDQFESVGIEVQYIDYRYPVYRQLYGQFQHGVSVIDLIFNEGPNALIYLNAQSYSNEETT